MTLQNRAVPVAHLAVETLQAANATPARIPWLFLLYALPVVLFLAFAMPAFRVADENDHARPADQISRGGPIFKQFGGGDRWRYGSVHIALQEHAVSS